MARSNYETIIALLEEAKGVARTNHSIVEIAIWVDHYLHTFRNRGADKERAVWHLVRSIRSPGAAWQSPTWDGYDFAGRRLASH